MNNKNLEIIPCPYCGSEPKLIRCGDQKEYYVYICGECYNTPVPYDKATKPSAARKHWNYYVIKINEIRNKEK